MFSRFASFSRRAIPRLVSSAKKATPIARVSALAAARRLFSNAAQAQRTRPAFSPLATVLAGTGLLGLGLLGAVEAAEQKVDYAQVRKDIADILDVEDYDDGSYAPVLVRLAWHASGTYDKASGTGGSNGATMRFKPESADGANNGLDLARKLLEPIKAKHPGISYADLWTLAGVVAVEELGGPTIPWRAGRVDKADGAACPPVGRLPDASKKADHVRNVFYRMGFNDQEIVALAGAHALGRCHTDRSGYEGPWTNAPTTFSNEYYRLLLEEKWTPRKWNGPMQFQDASGQLMMTPADLAFVEDPAFKKHVQAYAKDQDLFFKDFAAAYSKLLELGCKF